MIDPLKRTEARTPVRCAVVGLGRSGVDIHIALLRNSSSFNIIAVADNDKRRAQNIGRELRCKSYSSYADVLDISDVELVIIATPSNTHYDMAMMAIDSKKHVVLEKPIANSLEQLSSLISATRDSEYSITPFFNFRFSYEFGVIKSILEKKTIGDVFLIKRSVGYFNRRDDWQSLRKNGGGVLNAAAIHHLDQVLQLMDDSPTSVWSDIRRVVSKGDAEDHCKVLMKFPNEVVVDLEVSWSEAVSSYPWVIYGSHGAIQQCGNKLRCRWFSDSEVYFKESDQMSYLSSEEIDWHENEFVVSEDYALGLNMQFYDELFESLRADGNLQPVTLLSVLRTMEVMEALNHER